MADVSIDATVSTSTARGMRSVVFSTASIGYWFYIDSTGDFVFSKTTNGGATWGAANNLLGGFTTFVAFDVWFDQWTPGDAGTLIHTWSFDTTNDAVVYTSLNTTTDTIGNSAIAFQGASAVAGRGAFCSGTKTRSGYLYVAFDIDAGAEHGLTRSTNGGSVWSANLATTFVNATLDQCKLFPASNTGDNNDLWAVYHIAATDAFQIRPWDSSAGGQATSVSLGTLIDNTTDLTGQMMFDGALTSDGHLIVVAFTDRDTATSSCKVWSLYGDGVNPYPAVSSAKTNITTNIDDTYYPAVFIDQNTGTIYVAINGQLNGLQALGTSTSVMYVKSTDGGTTWQTSTGSVGFGYSENTPNAIFQVWAPISGPRFYVGWRIGTTLLGNAVNSIDVTPSGVTTVDSYSETNNAGSSNQLIDGDAVNNGAIGQAFTATGVNIGSAVFYLKKVGSPTGTAVARLYVISGTFGTSAVPTGSVLATSDTFTVSTLTTTFALTTFTFSAGNQYLMTNGTKYAVMLEYTAGSSGNSITIGTDQSSPTHAGNLCYHDGGGYGFVAGEDVCFYVYSAVSGPVSLPELIMQPMTPARLNMMR